MTLRRRLILHATLVAAVASAVAGTVVVGVSGLRQDFGVALEANARLRRLYEVGLHVANARRWVRDDPADLRRARAEAQVALLKLDGTTFRGTNDGTEPDAAWAAPGGEAEGVRTRLREAVARLDAPVAVASAPVSVPALDAALAEIASLSAETRTTIAARQQAADRKHRTTVAAIVALFAAAVVGVVVLAARLQRAVLTPVDRLGETVRRIASGRRGERVEPAGDAEFAALARDFNRMAAELDALCDDLERQVAVKGKALAQSERLASVGYLAAGVAHEINNPLGIIAGYGERALRHLRRGGLDGDAADRTARAIEVMCDEAFRCKGITDRLLSMSRPAPGADADAAAGPVCLDGLVDDVVTSARGLREAHGRTIAVERAGGSADGRWVNGRGPELRQMLLNLLVNALHATAAGGRVTVRLARDGDEAELAVCDDGVGMSPRTLERAFEPFFSGRPGEGRGTGLGLSITHAIVAGHGGRIRAESGGPAQGSRFVVRLPATAAPGTAAAAAAPARGAPGEVSVVAR